MSRPWGGQGDSPLTTWLCKRPKDAPLPAAVERAGGGIHIGFMMFSIRQRYLLVSGSLLTRP